MAGRGAGFAFRSMPGRFVTLLFLQSVQQNAEHTTSFPWYVLTWGSLVKDILLGCTKKKRVGGLNFCCGTLCRSQHHGDCRHSIENRVAVEDVLGQSKREVGGQRDSVLLLKGVLLNRRKLCLFGGGRSGRSGRGRGSSRWGRGGGALAVLVVCRIKVVDRAIAANVCASPVARKRLSRGAKAGGRVGEVKVHAAFHTASALEILGLGITITGRHSLLLCECDCGRGGGANS